MQPSEPRPGAFGSAVRRSMQQLDALATLPLDEHAVVYQQVHEDLQRALADIDDA